MLQLIASCEQQQKARLDAYRALATRSPEQQLNARVSDEHESGDRNQTAKLAAASLILPHEDLIPCSSLPPRRLTTSTGTVYWLDGSWSNYARPFVVKGSAQSGVCRLELHPMGAVSLGLGGRDAFVRGDNIRVLVTGRSGDALFPPANGGIVKCLEAQNAFEITYEGIPIGQTAVSYVMNESIPLELAPRVCLARVLDEFKKATSEWIFILPSEEPRNND